MLTDNNRGSGIAAAFQEPRQAGIQPPLEFLLFAVTLPAVRLEDRANVGLRMVMSAADDAATVCVNRIANKPA